MSTFGLYFAARFDLKQQLKLIALSFGIGAVMSFIVALAVPEIGIHGADHPGAWKGVYGYKNNLGSMMILATLAFVFVPVRPIHRFLKWICLFMSIALILLSTSKTSLVMVFLLFLILFFYHKYRWRGKVTVLFLDLGIFVIRMCRNNSFCLLGRYIGWSWKRPNFNRTYFDVGSNSH